jgi:antitoxin component YwqK of YwqJK toxin-antitoxin module
MQKTLLLFISLMVSCLAFGQGLNKLNEKGEKHGKWIVPYANSSIIRYEGQFENGKPVGKFVYYGPKVNKQKEIVHRGDGVAMAKFFNEAGIILAEGKYVNEKRDSLWRFYKSGDLNRTEEYDMGVLSGKSISFFDNGRPSIICFYKAGKKDSVELEFSKKGKIVKEISYKNGKKNGLFTIYYYDGKKELEGEYQDNEYVGELKSYNPDESLRMVMMFENGVEKSKRFVNSVNDFYYDDGVMERTETFVNGAKEGLVKEWYPNYEWVLKEEFDAKLQRNEVYKTLKNYIVKMEGNYRLGKKHGVFNYYNEDGSLKESVEYNMGAKLK